MADIQPLLAVHHDLDRVPSLAAVIAPPYDVSDPVDRARLLERTPLNIIAADLPDDRGAPLPERYRHSAELLRGWFDDGVLVQDERPALWALEQRFPGLDGRTVARRGLFARVRVTDYGRGRIRPHERTHPAAVEDRLALTHATRANLSPVFSLYDDPQHEVARLLEPAFTTQPPRATAVDDEGTEHRLWRLPNAEWIANVRAALADRELLIADGHHRYEAARRYAEELGGDGPHRYTLMLLVAQQDPGLVVQPTHRLIRGLKDDPPRQEALAGALRTHFDLTEISHAELRPPAVPGPLQLGYIDSHFQRAFRCTLKSQAIADAAMPGVPDAYRRLDTAALQALLLEGALGLTQGAIDRRDGLSYARNDEEALALVLDGSHDCAFFLRPCPVSQVAAVAAEGLTMPAKSTSFAPKVPTGLLLSPLR
jgi:uncharacterized protein (DUF1015 family)